MTIEEEIFTKAKADFSKISKYGFKKNQTLYKYSENIMDNKFRVDIEINQDGVVKGKVFDLSFDEEYFNFRMEENIGSFASQVKEEFKNLLIDIRNECFIKEYFLYAQSNRIASLIKEKYKSHPEFEWEKFPGFATFRNKDNKKWYGLIMNINQNKLIPNTNGEIEIINLKLEPTEIENLLKLDGFYPAYHMNKKNWISVILNDTVSDEKIMNLIAKSYSYTVTNKNNVKNEWLIPANPKYFDIEKALKENNIITWKQSTNIKVDDLVYLYVAEPYEYQDENLNIEKVMKIALITRYEKGKLSFNKLKEFGINAVRGPRYMPVALSEYIKKLK